MSYKSLAQKVLPRQNSVRFCFFAQKGVFNFQNSKKNGWPDKFYCPKDSKKVNIFEIGSLGVYDRGGLPRVYTVLRPYMYMYM